MGADPGTIQPNLPDWATRLVEGTIDPLNPGVEADGGVVVDYSNELPPPRRVVLDGEDELDHPHAG
jgi:hypothetical protein